MNSLITHKYDSTRQSSFVKTLPLQNNKWYQFPPTPQT